MSTDQEIDVLIIGAGPAGLMAATWMAQAGINTLVVEKKPHRTKVGRADGLESRTLEILDSFGLGTRIWAEANRTIEVCLWTGSKASIHRESVSSNHVPGMSKFQEATLGQGRIEEHLLGFIEQRSCVNIQWKTVPVLLDVDEQSVNTPGSYPIKVRLIPAEAGATNPTQRVETTVRAKYVIACDGAHSWTRKTLGLAMEGEISDESWGVLDCIPITSFPDIRKRCIIKSKTGNLMIIPREGKLVRFYVQLNARTAANFNTKRDASILLSIVQNILQPYKFATCHIEWSTVYTVGRRLCETPIVKNRIFLAGDAIHTHSPKAGQGMNVSMQDTYNLGWKLALVLRGICHPRILQTYQQERLPIAKRLLAFDRKMCHGVCSTASEQESLRKALAEENSLASGLCVTYQPGLLVSGVQKQRTSYHSDLSVEHSLSKTHLATNITVGARITSHQLLRQSDSSPWDLHQLCPSTGQWHLLVFGGDITNVTQMGRITRLAHFLSASDSCYQALNKHRVSSVFGTLCLYLVHCALRHRIELMNLPDVFRPFDPINGVEYGRVFADNELYHETCGNVSRAYGISPRGCLVLLRPDQHVAFIGNLEDTEELNFFFDRIMLT